MSFFLRMYVTILNKQVQAEVHVLSCKYNYCQYKYRYCYSEVQYGVTRLFAVGAKVPDME